MKTKLLFILIGGLQLCLFSCKNNFITPCCVLNPPPLQTSVFTKWNITSDSTFTGVGSTNHPVDYRGLPGDYFDIRTNDTIFTKEGAVLDTLTYKLLTDSTIVITSFGITFNGVPATSHITNFTAHSLTIASPIALTPGGEFGRKVILNR
jgi:hypothetical protein